MVDPVHENVIQATGNPADGIGAKAAAANAKAMKDAGDLGDLARQGKKNESKFSDWGKK